MHKLIHELLKVMLRLGVGHRGAPPSSRETRSSRRRQLRGPCMWDGAAKQIINVRSVIFTAPHRDSQHRAGIRLM